MSKENSNDAVFIRKLTEITEANLANEHFGVKELAEKAGISHSQLHRKLHKNTGQSASQFIREIRLNKAREFLQQEICTVSEIAYKVGFGSPTYFNKCFSDYFGYPPGEFKNHAHDNNQKTESLIKVENNPFSKQSIKTSSEKLRLSYNKILFAVLGILVIVTLSVFTYKYFMEKPDHIITDKSIAVLPLRNLSNDSTNIHRANGIMEDIFTSLSHIHEFKVKSLIYSQNFNYSDMTYPEIGLKMGVSYIMEGSLLPGKEHAKILIHLYHAETDDEIWSETYYVDLSDILAVVSKVSIQIAEELQAVLSPEEEEQINKRYTESEEAYKLYLDGRFLWQFRAEAGARENIEKSIKCYQQALEIDPNYCLAYVGLADAYLEFARKNFEYEKETVAASKESVFMALAIDDNLAEAYTTLGRIHSRFEYNWETAEADFKRAIEINPNYAMAHRWYYSCLLGLGRKDEARQHLDRAIELNPNSSAILSESYNYYFREGIYNKALNELEKLYMMKKGERSYISNKLDIYIRQGEGEKAVNEFKKLIPFEPDINIDKLDSMYAENRIEGLIRYLIELELRRKWGWVHYRMHIARNYALLGDKNASLDYLESNFENTRMVPAQLMPQIDLKHLRTEPRFIALLEQMNYGGD